MVKDNSDGQGGNPLLLLYTSLEISSQSQSLSGANLLLFLLCQAQIDWCRALCQVHQTYFISRSSQCSTTGVTKAVVCAILSVGWCI